MAAIITRLAVAHHAADSSPRGAAVEQTTHVEKKECSNAKDKGKNMLAIDTIIMVISLQCFY